MRYLFLTLLMLLPTLAFGQAIELKDMKGRAGRTVTLEIWIDTGADEITLVQAALWYDRAVLEPTGATSLLPGFHVQNFVTDPVWPGVETVLQLYGPQVAVHGYHLAGTIDFYVKQAKDTPILLDSNCARTCFVTSRPVVSICPTLGDAFFEGIVAPGSRDPRDIHAEKAPPAHRSWSYVKVVWANGIE